MLSKKLRSRPHLPMSTPQLLRTLWIANLVLAAAMVLALVLLIGGQPVERTPGAERWFYVNAAVNFSAITAGLFLHLSFGRSLRNSTFRTEAIRYAYLHRFAIFLPLYFAAIFAAVATLFAREVVNLLFTVTCFAAALHFYPSERRISRDVDHARNGE